MKTKDFILNKTINNFINVENLTVFFFSYCTFNDKTTMLLIALKHTTRSTQKAFFLSFFKPFGLFFPPECLWFGSKKNRLRIRYPKHFSNAFTRRTFRFVYVSN